MSSHRRYNNNLGLAGQIGGTTQQESLRNFQSAHSRSLNDDEISNVGKNNAKGQTTGEVGGTLFLADEGLENSRLDGRGVSRGGHNRNQSSNINADSSQMSP